MWLDSCPESKVISLGHGQHCARSFRLTPRPHRSSTPCVPSTSHATTRSAVTSHAPLRSARGQVEVPPRAARSFEVPRGHFFRIHCVDGPQAAGSGRGSGPWAGVSPHTCGRAWTGQGGGGFIEPAAVLKPRARASFGHMEDWRCSDSGTVADSLFHLIRPGKRGG